jgi:hypothetical protein
VRTRSRLMTRGRQQQRRAIHVGSICFVNSLDTLLTPASMIFSERQSSGGADTIATYDEGRQQQRRAIHVGSIFLLIHSTLF